jgi:hypothetical protein
MTQTDLIKSALDKLEVAPQFSVSTDNPRSTSNMMHRYAREQGIKIRTFAAGDKVVAVRVD